MALDNGCPLSEERLRESGRRVNQVSGTFEERAVGSPRLSADNLSVCCSEAGSCS